MSTRVPIPDDVAARVMFASDRTCCVCRLETNKTQIHHVDQDSSNNVWDNLAVVCLYCHSDAHTAGAFVRNLTPELVRLYNASWRALVAARLVPHDGSDESEFVSEVLLEAGLDCHSWKNRYFRLHDVSGPRSDTAYIDVWDALVGEWSHSYTEAVHRHFMPLFEEGLDDIRRRFDRLISLHRNELPYSLRTLLLRASRQLEGEQVAYRLLPQFARMPALDPTLFLNARFAGVIRVLSQVSRESDRLRQNLRTRQTGLY